VDKFNKLHRLVSHNREVDLQSCVAVVANQMFGSTAVYVDVKHGLTNNDIVTIPSGYVIDMTEANTPRLFVVKAVIAKNFPFWNTGVELFKFVAGFDEAQGAIRDYLHDQIAHDTEALARLDEARQLFHGNGVSDYLDAAVQGNFRGIVIIDDARAELNQVLSKINADISVLELKTFEAEDGSRLYQIETLYGEQHLAAGETDSGEEVVVHPLPDPEAASIPTEPLLPKGNEEDLKVAVSFISLAQVYRAQRKYSEAKRLIKRALAIQEHLLGLDHPDIATSLNRLALCYRAQGKLDKAKPLFERALTLREKVLPADDPRIATSLNNLALAYCAEGEQLFAQPLLERALGIKDKALGPDHPRVATCLYNLAQLYRALNKQAEAEPLYTRTLQIWEKTLGKHHPKVAKVLEDYALLLAEMRRPVQAASMLARAEAIRAKPLK
ncbi:MAG: tetratricopeptide repeat protein, partial [Acidiferrobacterales bacterium]